MPMEEEQEEDQSREEDTVRPAESADEAGADEPEEDFECQECVAPRILPDPGQPTQRQLEDHRVDHLPFRSWCPECVAGRAAGEQHIARKEEKQISTFSMDYLYLTKPRVVEREAPPKEEKSK